MNARKRVVITGMGCVTPMGARVEKMWTGLKNAASGVGYIPIFDAKQFPTKISAEVRDWDVDDVGEDPAVWRMRGRHARFAAGAAKHAVADAGINGSVEPTRFGVYLGSGEGQQDFTTFSRMMAAALSGGSFD